MNLSMRAVAASALAMLVTVPARVNPADRRFTMKRGVVALTAVWWMASSPASAQWLNYPTPGIPRLADGKPDLNAPAPRTADGKPDLSGLWKAAENRLSNLARELSMGEARMLPRTETLYQRRQENFRRDDPSARCIPGGVPRANLVTVFYPMRIITAGHGVVVMYEAIHGWREIFTDGRDVPADMNPTWMGYSVGRWDGDDFVVTTTGFNGNGWLDNAGLPAGERLRVTERFRRLSFGRMDVAITVDDPGHYTHPWTFRLPLTFQADTDLLEYVCNENNRYFDIVPKELPRGGGGK